MAGGKLYRLPSVVAGSIVHGRVGGCRVRAVGASRAWEGLCRSAIE